MTHEFDIRISACGISRARRLTMVNLALRGIDADLVDGMVVLPPFTNMPDDVKKMAEDSVAKIKSGEFHPFTGPITKQDGTTVGEAGKPLPDGELLGMNYYIKGVDDKLPQ